MKKNICSVLLILFCILGLSSCQDEAVQETPTVETPGEKPGRPHVHSFGDWVVDKEASLFNVGQKTQSCSGCDQTNVKMYYYLDEVVFQDKVYQYNGKEKKLLIEGLLPKGIRVEYNNNRLTNVGSIVSTANFINEDNEIVESKSATLTIIDYQGFPKVSINTNNQPIINKTDYVTSTITVSNCDASYQLSDVIAGVRLRGNGSLEAEKKPYRIKFEQKQSMLGLNDGLKAKSWVLLADYYDYSMLRNAAAFYLGNSLLNFNDYYSSDFQHVNLYINGIYNGVYLLAEQQQVNKGRIDIAEPEVNSEDINIGYLLELDTYAVNEGDFINLNLSGYQVKDYKGNSVALSNMSYSIKSDYYSVKQKNHINKYLNNVYKIMHSAITGDKYYKFDENYDLIEADFTNACDTINNVINLDSLFRVYILQEIMKNVDVGFSSFYMYVDFSSDSKCPRLTFGAPWDFDWSSGNMNGQPYYASTGHYNDSNFNHLNPWLLTISNAEFFEDYIKDYWELFEKSEVIEGLIYTLDDISSTYSKDFMQNFAKWNTLGIKKHVYSTDDVLGFKTQGDAKNFLKNWLLNRYSFLKTLWSKGE